MEKLETRDFEERKKDVISYLETLGDKWITFPVIDKETFSNPASCLKYLVEIAKEDSILKNKNHWSGNQLGRIFIDRYEENNFAVEGPPKNESLIKLIMKAALRPLFKKLI